VRSPNSQSMIDVRERIPAGFLGTGVTASPAGSARTPFRIRTGVWFCLLALALPAAAKSWVSISLTPASATLTASQSQQFTAKVGGSSNHSVNWTLSPATGTISAAGLYAAPATIVATQTVTVQAVSVADTSKTASVTITLLPPLAITAATLPNGGTTGVPYSATLAATGGSAPYTWSLLSGALPPGLSLTTSSGLISGTPTTAGSYTFTVQACDTVGNQASQSYAMAVAAPTGVTWGPTYYVAGQNGNDGWSGLLASPNSSYTDGPFQTLTRAQAAMQASSTVKTTTLRAGTYPIASAWSLNWYDSGERWISYPGETAILDGGGIGSINLSGVLHLGFEGLTFRNLGAPGLYLFGASSNIAIRWNTFDRCNTSCISGGGLTSSIIDSNIINGQSPGNPSGDTGHAYSAIMLWAGSSNNQLTHNLIENCQGGGIAFSAGPTDPPNNSNIVDRNILQNVETNVVDMGAIYMMDRSHSAVGNQITNNVINGNGGTGYLTNWTKAIYIDDLMSNVLVGGNICRYCGEFAWQIHGGDHNTIVNNIFDLSSVGTLVGLYQNVPAFTDYGMTGNVIERNIIYFSAAAPASLYQVDIGSSDALPTDSSQLYYSASGASIPNGKTILDASPFYANPEFTDPSAGNYSMAPSSPPYTWIQFQPLPTDQGPLPYAP
jgi:hypothetical protein